MALTVRLVEGSFCLHPLTRIQGYTAIFNMYLMNRTHMIKYLNLGNTSHVEQKFGKCFICLEYKLLTLHTISLSSLNQNIQF